MAIFVNYGIEKDLYYDPKTNHNIILITTEYFCGNNILVYLEQGSNLNIRLNNLLKYTSNKNTDFHQDLFFQKKAYSKKEANQITQNTFEEKIKKYDLNKITVEQEILEEYDYTDKNDNLNKIQIVIKIKNDSITAIVDFKDLNQYENFVCPAWLVDITASMLIKN
jgi:hypothetical protein